MREFLEGVGWTRVSTNRDLWKAYLANPSRCPNCKTPILPKQSSGYASFSRFRVRKFCNSSCAASFNNGAAPKRKRQTRACSKCGAMFIAERADSKRCSACYVKPSKPILSLKKSQVTRKAIAKLARKVVRDRPNVCQVCGYDRFIEVCHIRPVSTFTPHSGVQTINSAANLIKLCPNHHKELDSGIMSRAEAFALLQIDVPWQTKRHILM